ncbi:MAG: cytochrome c [Planctomycetes bacterium]|nr:cytochrome c [Planctomycetota bacterium]
MSVVVVGGLGFRGQTSTSRPWHVFLDMKYQPRYGAQGQSVFFADGRASRTPVAGTIPYDGGGTRNDAGDHGVPNRDFLPDADPIYYKGRFKPDEKQMVKVKVEKQRPKLDKEGQPLKDKDNKPVMETFEEEEDREITVNYFVEHIPKRAIDDAIYSDGVVGYKGWDALMRSGQVRYAINCTPCHGQSGYGGQGKAAHGMVGRGIRIDSKTGDPEGGMVGIASYHIDRLREVPDGYLFDVITNGKNSMASYGHQIRPQDRWAIVAYMRALQLSQYADEKLVDPIEKARLLGGAK